MSHTGDPSALTRKTRQMVRTDLDRIREADLCERVFILRELDQATENLIRRLLPTRAIKRVPDADNDRETAGSAYRLARPAREYVRARAEDRYGPCPCDHGGLRTLAEGYTCTYDGCDAVYERGELEVDG